jgi:hypothetical protein
LAEDLVKPGQEPVLASHEPELRIALRPDRELSRSMPLDLRLRKNGGDRHRKSPDAVTIAQLSGPRGSEEREY